VDPLLLSTLVKLAGPVVGIAALLAIVRWKGLSWRDDLGLATPRIAIGMSWLVVWIAWMAASEYVINTFHLDQAKPWPAYPPLIVALRVLAIGLAGPAAEELVMRGGLLGRLRRTRLGPVGAVVLVAAAWAAFHVSYEPSTIALIFLDGLVLGAARITSASVWVPLVMHAMGNLISIWQSTHP
jgi:membrane protease YdiL (CAAX protease family)